MRGQLRGRRGSAGRQLGLRNRADAYKIFGFNVVDRNTWWWVASSPWDKPYYVLADAFYNDRATASGSLITTPFVDPAVHNPDVRIGRGDMGI